MWNIETYNKLDQFCHWITYLCASETGHNQRPGRNSKIFWDIPGKLLATKAHQNYWGSLCNSINQKTHFGNRSSFWNTVFQFLEFWMMDTQSGTSVSLSVIHHCQNPSDSVYTSICAQTQTHIPWCYYIVVFPLHFPSVFQITVHPLKKLVLGQASLPVIYCQHLVILYYI